MTDESEKDTSVMQEVPVAKDTKNESLDPLGSKSNTDRETFPVRLHAGSLVTAVSDGINDNLIAFRYATMATVGLMTAYGIAHTPLFFRFRTVSELPSKYFRERRKIRCRVVNAIPSNTSLADPNSTGTPVLFQVRHLSLFERVLSKSWFDSLMRVHPAVAVTGSRPDERSDELMTVQIAGIVDSPLPDYHLGGRSQEFLQRLAREKTKVTCQLLGGKVSTIPADSSTPAKHKRDLVGMSSKETRDYKDNIAVAKIYYRPQGFQLVPTDMALSLVQTGRASASSVGMFVHANNETIVNASDSYLEEDAEYTGQLDRAEYKAAAGSYGMWNDPAVRKARSDVVAEVEFQTKAPFWKKAWRWFRNG